MYYSHCTTICWTTSLLDYHLKGLFQSGCVLFSFVLPLNILDNMDFIVKEKCVFVMPI